MAFWNSRVGVSSGGIVRRNPSMKVSRKSRCESCRSMIIFVGTANLGCDLRDIHGLATLV
jgi:hypothetical protein